MTEGIKTTEDDTEPVICPNCSEPMTLQTTIRRAFGEDTNVFQCRPCGLSATKTVKRAKAWPRKK